MAAAADVVRRAAEVGAPVYGVTTGLGPRVVQRLRDDELAAFSLATIRGRAMAVGLAYSRVTSPDPTVWFGPTEELFAPTLNDELAEADSSDGQLARLRPGAGDWRTRTEDRPPPQIRQVERGRSIANAERRRDQ